MQTGLFDDALFRVSVGSEGALVSLPFRMFPFRKEGTVTQFVILPLVFTGTGKFMGQCSAPTTVSLPGHPASFRFCYSAFTTGQRTFRSCMAFYAHSRLPFLVRFYPYFTLFPLLLCPRRVNLCYKLFPSNPSASIVRVNVVCRQFCPG